MHYLSNDITLQKPTEEYAGYPAILRHGYNEAKQEVVKGAAKSKGQDHAHPSDPEKRSKILPG